MAGEVERAVEAVARDLVRIQRVNGSSFLNLPMLYPDGSCVTVRVDPVSGGLRVSDNGFAYREAEDSAAVRSFSRGKRRIEEEFGVQFGGKVIFADTDSDGLFEAVCIVAAASWQSAARVFSRIPDEADDTLDDELNARLKLLFGAPRVEEHKELKGVSSVPWEVSAVVSFDDHRTVFQAVGDHPSSINRASTAFRDLSLLPRAPKLVAVVAAIDALGPRVGLLSQSGAAVIERGHADQQWRDAA